MVGHGGSSAGSHLADPASPIASHCASIVATSTLRVNTGPENRSLLLTHSLFQYPCTPSWEDMHASPTLLTTSPKHTNTVYLLPLMPACVVEGTHLCTVVSSPSCHCKHPSPSAYWAGQDTHPSTIPPETI